MQCLFEFHQFGRLARTLLLCAGLLLPALTFAQFTDMGSMGLTRVDYGSVAWGDYDNDGDLDILLTGHSSSGEIAKVYQNTGGAFTDIGAGLTGVRFSSAALGDYDNDGDLDILLTGEDAGLDRIAKVYQNTGGAFADMSAGLVGVRHGSAAWGDYDNDGDLDILLTGEGNGGVRNARVYRNVDGAFTDIGAGLTGVGHSSAAWGDYDNDGDLDILLVGDSSSGRIARVYRNVDGAFTDIGAGLTGVLYSSAAWGDYDNDGDLDILLTGDTASNIKISTVYRNDNGSFTDITAGLTGVRQGSVAWGDYDNDGDLDILLIGNSGIYQAKVYQNTDGAFTNIGAGLTGVVYSSVAWGDYDNDGDLDILLTGLTWETAFLAKVYRNDGTVFNSVPSAPENLTAAVNGNAATLSWNAASDGQTPSAGLTYNLMVGAASNGVNINSPMADVSTGYRRVVQLGGTNHNESWTLKNLSDGNYFWRVQAVDAAFAGSPFSEEGTFIVGEPEMDVLGNSVSIADGDVTPSSADHTDFGSADISSGSVDRTFTIANLGNVDLNLTGAPKVQITEANAADFSVTVQPTSPVAPSGSTTFTVHFDPSALGVRSATISIANDDADENPYDFAIQGTGAGAPEMDVRGKGISIADGDMTPSTADGTDFGSAEVGDHSPRLFFIYNTGAANLNLTGTPAVQISGPNAADFYLTTIYGSTVAPGANVEFDLVFTPSAPGLRTATVTIPNNDADENPYEFAIQGTGIGAPEMDVLGNSVSIADGDVTPSSADHTDFGSADISTGSVDRVFTIANLGNLDLNLSGSPLVQLSGANAAAFSVTAQPANPIAPSGSTTFTVHFDPSALGVRSATISIANDDADENPYEFAIQGTGIGAPEMDVRYNGISIADGDDTPSAADGTDFGAVNVGGHIGAMFLIYNTGSTNLNFTGTPTKVQISGPNASDFHFHLNDNTIAPGAYAELDAGFFPSAPGLRTAIITIPNNDADENPYEFAIQGTGIGVVSPFVFLANSKLTLKRDKQSTPTGDMHSNGTLTIEKGDPSTYNSNLTAVGKITIQLDNTINGDVTSATSISNAGTINGNASVGPVDTEALPSLSYSAGGQNKTVPQDGALTLAPGSYGIVTLNANGTLKLTSGEYFMNELRYNGSEAVIEIDLSSGDPVQINVVSNLQLGKEVAIQLLPHGESDSKLVTFNTLQSGAVSLGKGAYLLGSFNAPNANVTLLKNSQLRGAICANELIVERDCLFLHHDSPGTLPGPGNLPKPSGEAVSSEQLSVTSYQLEQNYPNPFNPSTVISFQLPAAGEVNLSIFNTNGQLVKQVASGNFASGRHTLVWDATDAHGERVASGVYLYVIKVGEFTAQRKLVLMK